ncbi:transcriptional repressor [Tulasnella sp. UAMH 9824]|nr:transcriptional repressor [Tulasnella sp. UAMH 9824]
MLPTSTSTSAASTPARSANTPSLPPPPAPPVPPSPIAPPPIQTASDMVDAEKVKKKHVCPTCSRPFTTSGHLARHLRVHTGERNHKCPFPGCETRCSRQDNLQQHYRIHLSPRSRRNSNAATRAAIAKAMEAQANGQNTPPASSPSTTLTLPPQAPRHHQSHPNLRPPPSPIENALGLDQSTNGGPPAPYHAPQTRSTLSVHHPSAAPGRYFSNGTTPGAGYDSPRSSSAASSVHGGAPGQTNSANPASAYPSPYSAGPMHHPLPPTGGNPTPGSRSVSYDRVAGGSSFPSPQSPAPNAYPSPEESHGATNGHTAHHTNGYTSSSYPQNASYPSHSTYSIPPPAQNNQYYHHQAPRVQAPASSAYPSHGPQSPPPILPPIQHHRPGWGSSYPPPPSHHQSWASAGAQQQNGHGSSSESGDEAPGSATSHHGPGSGWASSAPAPRPVSVSGGGPGGSY